MNRPVIILLAAASLWAGDVSIVQTSGRDAVSQDVLGSMRRAITARFKIKPFLEGRAVLTVLTGRDGEIRSICGYRGTLRDDTLIMSCAAELLQTQLAAADSIVLEITIPRCITSRRAVRCGDPSKNPSDPPTLVVIRTQGGEDDDNEPGLVYLDGTYLGCTEPGMVTEFLLRPGAHHLLFRDEPDDDIYDVFPAMLQNGFSYYVEQDFIVKALDPAEARALMAQHRLPRRAVPRERPYGLEDLGTEFGEILRKYAEDQAEEWNDYGDDRLDDLDFDTSMIELYDVPCSPMLSSGSPADDRHQADDLARLRENERYRGIRSVAVAGDSADHIQGLLISTNIDNPEITVDSLLICAHSPVRLNMPIGSHVIRIRHQGYYDRTVYEDVAKGTVKELDVSMRKYRIFFSPQVQFMYRGSGLKYGFGGEGGVEYRSHAFGMQGGFALDATDPDTSGVAAGDSAEGAYRLCVGGGLMYSYTGLGWSAVTFAPHVAAGYWTEFWSTEVWVDDTTTVQKTHTIDTYYAIAGFRCLLGTRRVRGIAGVDVSIKALPLYVRLFAGVSATIL